MSENKKPYAYYKAVVSNSLKNEYRANDNACNHIAFYDELPERESSDAMIENELAPQSPENLLMFLDNPRLHRALSQLTREELRIVYLMYLGYKHNEIAEDYGVSRATMTQRIGRIRKKIEKMYYGTTF